MYIFTFIISACSHIVTDLHVGANITPKQVLSAAGISKCWVCVFFFNTNQRLETEMWEVLSVGSKILEN